MPPLPGSRAPAVLGRPDMLRRLAAETPPIVNTGEEGDAMPSRLSSYVLLAGLLSAVALAPWCGAAPAGDEPLTHMSVQGRVSPAGGFVGHLTIVALTVDDAGQLLLTGVLTGTMSHRPGAKGQIMQQTFTAPATLSDPGRTTDVVLLTIEPIALTSRGVQIQLARITLDIDDLPSEVDVLLHLLNELS